MNSYKFQKDFAWISRYKFRSNHKQSFSIVAIYKNAKDSYF